MEVIKPVLDELEAMRLCRSFGMMSSVNPKDFDFDVLHARAFDEDFARFLRCDLFENKFAANVRVKGLFGKQDEVAATLVNMKACSAEMVASLTKSREGVYCVKIEGDFSSDSNRADNEKKDNGLVVFSWIRDELFEPQALRDTPALLLRFLTVLSPDIICCMSASDLEQLIAAIVDSEKQDEKEEDLSSYSVSFSVEKQEDAHDGTVCLAYSSVDLEDAMKDCSSMCLLNGNYPALLLIKRSDPVVRAEPFQQAFPVSAQLSFAAWLKAESQQHRIELSGAIARSPALCENILREYDIWPEAQVKASREEHDKKKRAEYELASRQLDEDIVKQRAAVREIVNPLFQVGSSCSVEVTTAEAVVRYEVFQKWVKTKGSWKIDRKSKLKLDIPSRLRDIERGLFELYLQNQEADLETVVSMCATLSKAQIMQAVAKRRDGQHSNDSKGRSSAAPWKAFGRKVAIPLSKQQKQCWLAVESGLAAVKTAGLEKLTRDQKQAKFELDPATKRITQSKFEQLRQTLQSNSGSLLTLSAFMGRGTVFVKGSKEVLTSVSVSQEAVKMHMNGCASNSVRLESLGYHSLDSDKAHMAMFTVKTRSAIQACTSGGRMCIMLIQFPSGNDGHPLSSRASEQVINTLGRIASVCDFNCRSRTVTFLSDDSVGVYKFDEAFKRMDRIKVIDLGVRYTLTAPPFTGVVLVDRTVYVTDSSGCSQGIDIHTDVISNSMSMSDNDAQNARASDLMPFADQLAVGVVAVEARTGGSFEGKLRCVAIDNVYRHLPVFPLDVAFLTGNLHVQRVNGGILVADTLAQKLYVFSIEVTVKSSSYRLRQFDEDEDEDRHKSI